MKTHLAYLSERRKSSDLKAVENIIEKIRATGLFADRVSIVTSTKELPSVLSEKCDICFLSGFDKEKDFVKTLADNGFKQTDENLFKGKYPLVVLGENTDLASEVKNVLKKNVGTLTFKLFGANESRLKETIKAITSLYSGVFFDYIVIDDDVKVTVFYSDSTPKMIVDDAVKNFIRAFRQELYAEDDTSLYERFYQAAKLRGKIVSTAESMTGGRIAANIVSVKGASEIFYEGFITYDTRSKIDRLSVSEQTIKENGVVSAPVAYEMAKGITDFGFANVAITITGYAGGKEKADTDGLCFIGVSVDKNVKVYKYKFSGDREDVIKKAANTAIFVALKDILEAV